MVVGCPVKRTLRDPKMKVALFLLFAFASSPMCAQRTDTTEVKNGMYGVYRSDASGTALGPMAVYDTTGRLLRHLSYKNGLLHGEMIHFDSLGRKTWTQEYRKGKRQGRETYLYPDGSVLFKAQYRNGAIHGLNTTYHPNGRVEWTKSYRDGKLHGERVLRDSSGALFNGEYVTAFPLGRGHYTCMCINGRPQGKLVAILKSGQVAYTGSYRDGFPDGEFIFFSPDGSVWRKEYYQMGTFIRSTQRGNNGAHTPDQYPVPHPNER